MSTESDDLREFNSSHRFHSRIARERRLGQAFVRDEANRVRRELGLPERTAATGIREAAQRLKLALERIGLRP